MSLADKFGWDKKELPTVDYFVLDCWVDEEYVEFNNLVQLESSYADWRSGEAFNPGPDKILHREAESENNGIFPLVCSWLDVPMISRELYEAMKDCGINNLDVYDIEVYMPGSGKTYSGYLAFNLVGKVGPEDTENDECTVDSKKLDGVLLFRSPVSRQTLLIHKSVKEKLENQFGDLRFYHPENYGIKFSD